MSRITINGKSFVVNGPLSQINGKWYDGTGQVIDLENLEGIKEAKTINITIEGPVERLDVEHCSTIVVNGDCKRVKTTSGDIKCQNIEGDAESVSGDIECETIHGDAKTVSGNIRSGEIKGKAGTTTGKVNGQRSSCSGGVHVDQMFGSLFGSTNTIYSSGSVETITGGFSEIRMADGKKHIMLNRNCTINGRRIGDMSKEELDAWIAAKAAKGKIVTIID